MKTQVFCVGGLVADVISGPLDSLPRDGEVVVLKMMKLFRGGCAANTGYGLAQLGVPVRVIGRVGQDFFGEFVRNSLRGSGVLVDTIILDRNNHSTSCVVLVSREGERSFCYHPGATEALNDADLKKSGWDRAPAGSILHVATPSKLEKLDIPALLRDAQRKNLVTSLDLDGNSNTRWVKKVRAGLPHTDVLFCNFGEGQMLTGKITPREICRAVLGSGVKKLVLKFGAGGSMLVTPEESVKVSSQKVRAVDGTGAGDLFAAGFLAWAFKKGLFRKPSWSPGEIREILQFANLCGATCATQVGASLGPATFRSLQQLRQRVYGKS